MKKAYYLSQNWPFAYLAMDPAELYRQFKSSSTGLSSSEAQNRLSQYGLNQAVVKSPHTIWFEIGRRLINPFIILLLAVAGLSFFFGDKISSSIISLMIVMSVSLSVIQERRAEHAADHLNALVRTTTAVWRDGKLTEKSIKEIVPGDLINLSAGDIIPADLRIVSSKDLFLDQSSLTGESLPVEKFSTQLPSDTAKTPAAANVALMGSTVVSGSGLGLVTHTGSNTDFGQISKQLAESQAETIFDKEVKQFTWLMLRAILLIVAVLLLVYSIRSHHFLTALIYALAVAIQITPETLPMIITINLSKGALAMAKKKVIVKHLYSIQNFGAMDILCTDKTGTLTMNEVILEHHYNVQGVEDEEVLRFGYLNSFYQTGLRNLLDEAVLKHEKFATPNYEKIDEVPFDFSRKIMSVVVKEASENLLIAKGAPEEIFKRCGFYEENGQVIKLHGVLLPKLQEEYERLSAEGFRVLAVAYKKFPQTKNVFAAGDEQDLVLKGYMAFLDPPKSTAKKTLQSLRAAGIRLKVLTGDNELVTKKICLEVGLEIKGVLTGVQIESMSDAELAAAAETTTVFARVLPLQKERIIKALRVNNHVVGYLGDGINDALALKAADVGISVNNATDVAKDSASIILLEKSLAAITDGVIEGRRVFGNFMKYLRMTSTVNFSYMITTTVASGLLPFLPMAPVQILLNNYLYEVTQTAIPSDQVDSDYVKKPRTWSIGLIMRFTSIMGPLCSFFDLVTFAGLWFLIKAFVNPAMFQTGWFLESILAQTLMIYMIRTQKIPFIQSRPSKFLIGMTLSILIIVFVLPYTVLAAPLRLVALPALYYLMVAVIIICYLTAVWFTNRWFLRKYEPA